MSIVGDYDWVKGGSSEKYVQELSLRNDGTAHYEESSETYSEFWKRTGDGKWNEEEGVVWVILAELKKKRKLRRSQFHLFRDLKMESKLITTWPLIFN